MQAAATKWTWIEILTDAYRIFDDLEGRGFGRAPFSLGGGTVLMLHYKHRLSIDIDLFGYDAQWMSLVTPRLNENTAAIAKSYVEQANSVKIVMAKGDIDFVIAGDVTRSPVRKKSIIAGREIEIDPPSEVLAKKMFYRAATFRARDVYDLSTAIDLAPDVAREAVQAAASRKAILSQRLASMEGMSEDMLLADIMPYDGALQHGDHMVSKVTAFVNTHVPLDHEADRRVGG